MTAAAAPQAPACLLTVLTKVTALGSVLQPISCIWLQLGASNVSQACTLEQSLLSYCKKLAAIGAAVSALSSVQARQCNKLQVVINRGTMPLHIAFLNSKPDSCADMPSTYKANAAMHELQEEISRNQAELMEAIADRAALEKELQTAHHVRQEAASL